MRHLLRLTVSIALLSVVVVGCGVGAPTQAPTQAAPAAQPTAVSATAVSATAGPAAGAPPTAVQPPVTIVDWNYSGDMQKPFQLYMANPFEASHPGVTVKLLGGITDDAIAQIKAAGGATPFDSISLGESRFLELKSNGWILPLTEADVPNMKDVDPGLQAHCAGNGVAWTYSMMGLQYNPKIVPKPVNWTDLWKPEYKGKIGLSDPAANLGFVFLNLIAKLNGGSESNVAVAYQKIKELKPFIVQADPDQLSSLLERGEIGVAVEWSDNAAVAFAKGTGIQYTIPLPGGVAVPTCYTVLKGSAHPDLAKQYINAAVSADFQSKISAAPYYFEPTNSKVTAPPDAISNGFAPTPDQLKIW